MVMVEAQSRFEVAAGYVVVLSCPEEPDSVKIGTTATAPGPSLLHSESRSAAEPMAAGSTYWTRSLPPRTE